MREKTNMANAPVKKYRSAGITLTVWNNTLEAKGDKPAGSYKTFNFERSYKDAKGEWQNTGSLRKQDLPVVEMLVRRAFEDVSLGSDEE